MALIRRGAYPGSTSNDWPWQWHEYQEVSEFFGAEAHRVDCLPRPGEYLDWLPHPQEWAAFQDRHSCPFTMAMSGDALTDMDVQHPWLLDRKHALFNPAKLNICPPPGLEGMHEGLQSSSRFLHPFGIPRLPAAIDACGDAMQHWGCPGAGKTLDSPNKLKFDDCGPGVLPNLPEGDVSRDTQIGAGRTWDSPNKWKFDECDPGVLPNLLEGDVSRDTQIGTGKTWESPNQWKFDECCQGVLPNLPEGDVSRDTQIEQGCIEGKASAGMRTLLLAYLPRDATEEQLKTFFGSYGAIMVLNLCKDKSGASLCYGFLRYREALAAQQLIDDCSRGSVIMRDDAGKAWHVKASWAKTAFGKSGKKGNRSRGQA